MARLNIELPSEFVFSTCIPVRIGDTNRASHVSHIALVTILEEARAQFIVAQEYSNQAFVNQGTGYILGDLAVIFKHQAYYGQSLKVDITAVDFTVKSFDLVYKISDPASGAEIARARTRCIAYDYEKQQTAPVPQKFRDRFLR